MIVVRQKQFSRQIISNLLRKSKLGWQERKDISEYLEGVAFRQKRRDAARLVGTRTAKANILGGSSKAVMNKATDPLIERAQSLANQNYNLQRETSLLTKRFKKVVK